MLRLIALRGVRAHKNVAHFAGETLYIHMGRSRVVELYSFGKQIMQNNEKIQHKHIIRYILVVS